MATMKEWSDEAKGLTDKEIKRYKDALNTLASWDFFQKEYGWTGFETLATILQFACEKGE